MIEVYRAAGQAEAELIKGMLESYGIPCVLKCHAALSVHVFTINGMGTVKVMVPDAVAEEARILITREDDAQMVERTG
jgi:hypothetical protein